MTKHILITGAAGFIGFHAAQQLKRRGDFVIGLDNFNDYYSLALKKARSQILQMQDIPCIIGDINDGELLENTIDSNEITHILHLAAQAGVRYSLTNPQTYLKTNIDGFCSVLEILRHRPHIPLIYASSSSVYGANTKIPFSLNDHTHSPTSLYGATKKTNELLAYTYHHLFNIPVTGLRFFTVYGPWGRPDMAYYSFTEAIIEGKPIQVFNHGRCQRDFTYIDDIVDGIVSAIDLESPCEIFNFGNNKPIDLEKFITIIETELGITAQKEYLPMQPGDVVTTYADIHHSASLLGYRPSTTIEKGIASFIKWYREYIHN